MRKSKEKIVRAVIVWKQEGKNLEADRERGG